MDYLNYYPPETFYVEAVSRKLDFICIDVGSECSGLAITLISQRDSYQIPFIDRAEDFEIDNYVLSPMEKFFKAQGGLLTALQVLRPRSMRTCVIREILNKLARDYDILGFLIGYSPNPIKGFNRKKNPFVTNLLRRLNRDRRLQPRNFTIIDESHSTRHAKHWIRTNLRELATVSSLRRAYPGLKYYYPHWDSDQTYRRLKRHLKYFKKQLTDCQAAIYFSRNYIIKCRCGVLRQSADSRRNYEQIAMYVRYLGYNRY